MRIEMAFRAAHRLAVCGSHQWGVTLSEERVADIVRAATAAAPCEAIAVATAIAEIDTATAIASGAHPGEQRGVTAPTAHVWGAGGWILALSDEDEDGSGETVEIRIGPAGPIQPPDVARAWVRVVRPDGTTAIEAEVLIYAHIVRAESCSAPRERGDDRLVTERELNRLLGAVGAIISPRDWPARRASAEHLLRADLDAIGLPHAVSRTR